MKCLLTSPKGKTLLFQADKEHSSNTWNFTRLTLPKPIQTKKPLFIMQDDKGNVTLQFAKREGSSSSYLRK